ncbi:cephalosporin hydroxylase family protein [Cupriavidus basilensis]
MGPIETFQNEVKENIRVLGSDPALRAGSREWMFSVAEGKYSYNFSWLGRPIIQVPQDIIAMQELIFRIQPDLIIETGIAHGGSLIFSASMLELNAICGGPQHAEVLGIDVDIRAHNREAIEAHPMARRITMLQGSSIDPEIVRQVKEKASGKARVLVCLDSNHTHAHVLAELQAYAPLTTPGSYCVVFDTVVEDQPEHLSSARPWGKGNNPKTAVWAYLEGIERERTLAADGDPLRFEIDRQVEDKLLITVAPDGYLKRV